MKYTIIIMLVLFSFLTCKSVQLPDKEDHPAFYPCFMADTCFARNAENKDKSLCSGLVTLCIDVIKIEGIKEAIKYCSKEENRTKELSFSTCLEKLKY